MNTTYNLDEIFEIAERIEEDGAAFYRKAASLQENTENKTVLEDLAEMEDDHKATFAKLRSETQLEHTVDTEFDPYMESVAYLNATADAHGGEGSVSVTASLTGNETIKEIVNIAVGLEKDSIIFYLGILDTVSHENDREKVKQIIAEEKSHLSKLALIHKDFSNASK